MHEEYDQELVDEVISVYLNAADTEAALFDFEQAWQWAGFESRSIAKDSLLKVLERRAAEKTDQNQAQEDETKEEENHQWLTVGVFEELCLEAETDQGVVLRDLLVYFNLNKRRFSTDNGRKMVKKDAMAKLKRDSRREQGLEGETTCDDVPLATHVATEAEADTDMPDQDAVEQPPAVASVPTPPVQHTNSGPSQHAHTIIIKNNTIKNYFNNK